MPRPEFPNPYCILTKEMISRIRSDQDYYDQNPEQSEREQREQQEREDEERHREQERYDEWADGQSN